MKSLSLGVYSSIHLRVIVILRCLSKWYGSKERLFRTMLLITISAICATFAWNVSGEKNNALTGLINESKLDQRPAPGAGLSEDVNKLVLEELLSVKRKINEIENAATVREARIVELETAAREREESISKREGSQGQLPDVSFSARIYSSIPSFSAGQTIVFGMAVNNAGGHYNADTGVFTAPLSGKYFFSLTILVAFKSSAHVYLYRDNSWIGGIAPDTTGQSNWYDMDSSSLSQVLDLEAGNTVYVKYSSAYAPNGGKSIYGRGQNWFSGFLISVK